MKVPYIFRATAITLGVAATLVLAGAASAQEIDNTEWKERAGATAPVAASLDQTATSVTPVKQTQTASTTDANKQAVQEAVVAPAGALGTIAVSIIGVGGVALFAWTQKKRNRNLDPQASHDERSVSL